nr:immunoglobulin light chain junction region [Macaca mulatta]
DYYCATYHSSAYIF